jgi:hypothetical protein
MGSKIKMGQQLSLRLEARYRSTNTNPRSPLYTDMRGNEFSYDPSWYHSLEVTGGLTYRIGG